MSGPPANTQLENQTNRRISHRRAITRRVGIVMRRGVLGLGPNLAMGLIDASVDGFGIKLRSSVNYGDEVELEITAPGTGKPVKLTGDVRWCMAVGDGTFQAGVRIRRRLTPGELNSLIG